MRRIRLVLTAVVLGALCLVATDVQADSVATGERSHGGVTIEPAYNDADGSIVYLQTPNRLAPLAPTNTINGVNQHATAPLYIVVYPSGTPGVFNCMGDPGNCPDHDGAIAGLATSFEKGVYGSNPALVPGHDHLVGGHGSGNFNAPWHVYVELFTSTSAVTHITTLAELQKAWDSHSLLEIDTGITFLCSIVSVNSYLSGTPVG